MGTRRPQKPGGPVKPQAEARPPQSQPPIPPLPGVDPWSMLAGLRLWGAGPTPGAQEPGRTAKPSGKTLSIRLLLGALVGGGGISIGGIFFRPIASPVNWLVWACVTFALVLYSWLECRKAALSVMWCAFAFLVVWHLVIAQPEIRDPKANPSPVEDGQPFTLSWKTDGALWVELSSESRGSGLDKGWQPVEREGRRDIHPEGAGKKVYRLRAGRFFRKTKPTTVTVVVDKPLPPPPPPKPVIDHFEAKPQVIESGDPVSLTWKTRHADTVELLGAGPGHGLPNDRLPVQASGELVVQPATVGDYTYTLRASSGNGGAPPWQRTVSVREPVMVKFESVEFRTGKDNKNANTVLSVRVVDKKQVLYASYTQQGLEEFPIFKSIEIPLKAPGQVRAAEVANLFIEISIAPKGRDDWYFGFTLNATRSDGTPCPTVQPNQHLSQNKRGLLLPLKACPERR